MNDYSKVYFFKPNSTHQFGEFLLYVDLALIVINGSFRRFIVKKDSVFDRATEIFTTDQGDFFISNNPKKGKYSRFAVAWWTDSSKTTKAVRIFGDRIEAKDEIYLRLYPFGISPFGIIFPDNEWNKYFCNRCFTFSKELFILDEQTLVCPKCKYLEETGFFPGLRVKNA